MLLQNAHSYKSYGVWITDNRGLDYHPKMRYQGLGFAEIHPRKPGPFAVQTKSRSKPLDRSWGLDWAKSERVWFILGRVPLGLPNSMT